MKTYNFTRFPSGQEEHIDTKCSKSSGCFCSCSKTENPCTCSSSSILKCETTLETQSPQMHLSSCVTEPSAGNLNEHYHQEFSSLNCQYSDLQVKHLATSVIKLVVNNALSVMDGQSQSNISNCLSNSEDQTDYTTEKSCEVCHHPADGGRETLEGKKEKVQDGKNLLEEQIDGDKKNEEVKSEGTGKENIPGIYCHDDRPGLDEFKEFLRGTPGETMINFWMDIEKLKTLQSREQKNRYLVLMRSRYLLSSSRSSLNAELLSRLGLATSPCWTEEKLCSVQPCLTEALLFYWAPRFWTSQCVQGDHDDAPNVGLRTEWYYSPPSGGQPYCSFLALPLSRHDTCLPPSSNIVHTELYSSTSDLLGSRGVEQVLQALCFESRAGLYFTRFCEQSGNQLWENAVYFWTDLQHYHELFYQDGMDPYRVQREAQLLYATYLNSSARRSIGVDEGIRREVYNRLMPAFEELFDEVEEHALNILLQPWTLLVSRDKESFQKVSVQEEVRTVDSQEYRELQSMYQESESRRKQASSAPMNSTD
uniref:RGS domain-containing protein n=1 Tax=Monopterus albus TaxID=43700 RepID=A0A3Q3JGH4_MONAL